MAISKSQRTAGGKLKLIKNRNKKPVKTKVGNNAGKPVETEATSQQPEVGSQKLTETKSIQPNSLQSIDKNETSQKNEPQQIIEQNMEEITKTNTAISDETIDKPETKVKTSPSNKAPKFELPSDKTDFNPFKEQPIIRDSGIAGNQADNTQPLSQEEEIPEPDISPDPNDTVGVGISSDDNESQPIDAAQNSENEGGGGSNMDNVNPALNDLSDADKYNAAKAAATELTNVYCTYKPVLFTWISKPNEKKINKLITSGELDPDLELQTEDGTVSFKESIAQIKSQSEQLYTPSEDFKQHIIPPLTQVLLKRSIGLTPEQQCLAIVVQDMGTSTIQLVQIKNYTKQLVETAVEMSKQMQINIKEKDTEIDELKRELEFAKKRAEKAEKDRDKHGEKIPEATVIDTIKIKPSARVDEGDQ